MENQKILKKIGVKIVNIRKEKRLSQEEIGSKVGMSPTYFIQIEKGKVAISIINFLKILKALEVTPHEFFKDIPVKDVQIEADIVQEKWKKHEKDILKFSKGIQTINLNFRQKIILLEIFGYLKINFVFKKLK